MQEKCRQGLWWLHCWSRGGLLLCRARGSQGFPWAWPEVLNKIWTGLRMLPQGVPCHCGSAPGILGEYKQHSGVVQGLSWTSRTFLLPRVLSQLCSRRSRTQMIPSHLSPLPRTGLAPASNPGAETHCWTSLQQPQPPLLGWSCCNSH